MTDKLKILFLIFTHSNGGGGESTLTTLVNNIPKEWQIDIFEIINYGVKKEKVNESVNVLPPFMNNNDTNKKKDVFYFILYHYPELIVKIRKLSGYDVVVCWMPYFSSSLMPCFSMAKKIVWIHGPVEDLKVVAKKGTCDYFAQSFFFKRYSNAFHVADKVVTISKSCLNSFIKLFPKEKEKIQVIYNGTDIETVKALSKEKIQDANVAKIYAKFLKEDIPILIALGNFNSRKNFSLALYAIAVLKKRNIECCLFILGQGELESKLKELIHMLDIADRAFLAGYQLNPYPFYYSAKLLLVTSLVEGWALVASDAMALGIPFVTTPVEGTSEELANNETCGLVSNWNKEEYADKIELLLKDKILYKRMSDACKKHIKNYSVERTKDNFLNLIKNISDKQVLKKRVLFKRYNIVLTALRLIIYYGIHKTFKSGYRMDILYNSFCDVIVKPNLPNIKKLIKKSIGLTIRILAFPMQLVHSFWIVFRYRKDIFVGYYNA